MGRTVSGVSQLIIKEITKKVIMCSGSVLDLLRLLKFTTLSTAISHFALFLEKMNIKVHFKSTNYAKILPV